MDLVVLLNKIFSTFDLLAKQHDLEKIKTIGDAYMIVGGLPTPRKDHAEAMAQMALDMQREIAQFNDLDAKPILLRIGIHTGPVIAGVIGESKFSYDLWGNTVNIASRMESHCLNGHIQVSANTYHYLQDKYLFSDKMEIDIKGHEKISTYFLNGKKQYVKTKQPALQAAFYYLFFETLKKEEGFAMSVIHEVFKTHPVTDERIEALSKAKKPIQEQPFDNNWEDVKIELKKLLDNNHKH